VVHGSNAFNFDIIEDRHPLRGFERWEKMTPEEREKFREGLHDRSGRTTPLDSEPNA